MAMMNRLVLAAAAAALIAGCAHAQPAAPVPASSNKEIADLQVRVAKLEAVNAQYAQALAFLKQVYDQQTKQQADQDANALAPDGVYAVPVADDVKAGQVDGPASAYVTIVEGWDFACPYCERMSKTLDELVAEYPGKVRVVYKNLIIHTQIATPAHLAGCAAAKQGKFLAFKRAFWENAFEPYAAARDPDKLGRANILVIAKGLGLDVKRLETDMDGAECRARVDADIADFDKFRVESTPTFFVNGTYVAGAMDKPDFKQLIETKLAAAEKSGIPAASYYDTVILAKGEHEFRSAAPPKK